MTTDRYQAVMLEGVGVDDRIANPVVAFTCGHKHKQLERANVCANRLANKRVREHWNGYTVRVQALDQERRDDH